MESSHAFSLDETRRHYGGPGLDGRHVPGLSDEVGERIVILDERGAPSLELLRFRQTLTTIPGFEVALRRRVERLRQFRHAAFAKTPAVEYLGKDQCLALLSSYIAGRRLSEVLAHAQDPVLASSLIHQLTPALNALHDHGDGIGHGALTASRIVISPAGQPIIVEHVLGPALERLHLTAAGMRRDLRIPVPEAEAAPPRNDGSTDCFQLAIAALSMLRGRALDSDEYQDLHAVVDAVLPASDRNSAESIGGLREWLERALQLDGRAFLSSSEATQALHTVDAPPSDIGQRWRELLNVRSEVEAERVVVFQVPEVLADPAPEVVMLEPPDVEPAADRIPDGRQSAAQSDRPAAAPIFDDPPEPRKQPAIVSQLLSYFVARDGALRWTVLAITALAVLEAFLIAMLLARRASTPPPATFTEVALMTVEPGAAVTVNGQSAGVTPLQLTIGPETRSISIASPQSPVKQESIVGSTGQQHTPLDAGRERGAAEPRTRTAPPAAPAPPAPRPGGFNVSSPIELEVFEGNTRIGSTSAGTLSAAAGRHEFDLVSSALGFRTRQVVDLKAGQTVSLTVTPPNGRININAVPWAEVLIDGKSVGETPIGNLSIPLGEHEITFRHPQLGEVRRTAIVRSDAVTRVSATLQR